MRPKQFKCRMFLGSPGRKRIAAEAMVSPLPISFFGEVDMDSGRIIVKGHPCEGMEVAGKILVMPGAKGSTANSLSLRNLSVKGGAPRAIVTTIPPDYNLVEGVILGKIPLAYCKRQDLLDRVKNGDRIEMDSEKSTLIFP